MGHFLCDLLKPLIFGEIEAEATNRFLKQLAQKEALFPDGRSPSLRLQPCGANSTATGRRIRCAFSTRSLGPGQARNTGQEVMQKAIELKRFIRLMRTLPNESP